MKYVRPISDATYIVYKSHLRRARREGNVQATVEWEEKLRLSGRPIPVDIDPRSVSATYEVAKGLKVDGEEVVEEMKDSAYEAFCLSYQRDAQSGNILHMAELEIRFKKAGRPIPVILQRETL